MRIFDETKKNELKEYDLEKGYLKPEKILVASHPAVEAVMSEGHYKVVKEYPNGGKDVEWIVDVPEVEAKEAWDEYEDIQVYVPFSEAELAEVEIRGLKQELNNTDYQAIKCYEKFMLELIEALPELPNSILEPVKEYKKNHGEPRQKMRDKINELERKCHK